VTKKDVRDAARKYLRDDNLTLVKLVPRTQREKSPRAQTEALSQGQETVVREVLPNGIRVIARQNRGLPMISLTVSCLGGLRAEDEKTNGISHLVSRLLLKGTSKRREEEIAGAVEARGGSLEAFSGLNSFGVSLRCLKDDADFCLDLVKDILSDSVVPEGEIEKEKTLALAQIKSEEDDIFEKGVHVFRKALFKAHPYGFRIAGEPDTLKALGRGDLLQFYKRWCVPANIVIAVSGDADPRGFIEKARALFSDMKRADPPRVSTPPAAPSSEKTKFEMAKDQTLILLGYKTVTLGDPDRFTFEVLASILSGSNGRLFEDLRGRFGLAYALGVTQIFGMDPGYFAFYVATTRDKCESVRKGLLDEILELRTKGVSDEEVEHAKRELITAHRTSLQTNEFVSSQMALDELYGLGYDSIYHYDEQIARVTAEEIKRVAKKYFDASAYTEVIINPGR
jgi:zinc protease